jgi:hypothetical protein
VKLELGSLALKLVQMDLSVKLVLRSFTVKLELGSLTLKLVQMDLTNRDNESQSKHRVTLA